MTTISKERAEELATNWSHAWSSADSSRESFYQFILPRLKTLCEPVEGDALTGGQRAWLNVMSDAYLASRSNDNLLGIAMELRATLLRLHPEPAPPQTKEQAAVALAEKLVLRRLGNAVANISPELDNYLAARQREEDAKGKA